MHQQEFRIKVGSTKKSISMLITSADNLVGADSVKFSMTRVGKTTPTVNDATGTIISTTAPTATEPSKMIVSYTFTTAQLAVEGVYLGVFSPVYGSNRFVNPNSGSIVIYIEK